MPDGERLTQARSLKSLMIGVTCSCMLLDKRDLLFGAFSTKPLRRRFKF
jgi:hypothetical protein